MKFKSTKKNVNKKKTRKSVQRFFYGPKINSKAKKRQLFRQY